MCDGEASRPVHYSEEKGDGEVHVFSLWEPGSRGELRTLHEDAEQWLINRIKRQHPEWVSADGACSPCIEAFKTKHGVTDHPEGR